MRAHRTLGKDDGITFSSRRFQVERVHDLEKNRPRVIFDTLWSSACGTVTYRYVLLWQIFVLIIQSILSVQSLGVDDGVVETFLFVHEGTFQNHPSLFVFLKPNHVSSKLSTLRLRLDAGPSCWIAQTQNKKLLAHLSFFGGKLINPSQLCFAKFARHVPHDVTPGQHDAFLLLAIDGIIKRVHYAVLECRDVGTRSAYLYLRFTTLLNR